jgi:hypothetical protein
MSVSKLDFNKPYYSAIPEIKSEELNDFKESNATEENVGRQKITFHDFKQLSEIEIINSYICQLNELLTKLEDFNPDNVDKTELFKDEIKSSFTQCCQIMGGLTEPRNIKFFNNYIQFVATRFDNDKFDALFTKMGLRDGDFDIKKKIEELVETQAKIVTEYEDKYIDKYRILKGKDPANNQKIQEIYNQWFLSQAILHEKIQGLDDVVTQKQLSHIILQLYKKAAPFEYNEIETFHIQTNPFSKGDQKYYREYNFEYYRKCTEAYAHDMKIGSENLFLIDSPLLQEVFERTMPHPRMDLNIDSLEKLDALIDAFLLLNDSDDEHLEYPILVDITKLIKNGIVQLKEIDEVINKFEVSLLQKFNNHPKKLLLFQIKTQLQIIAFINHKGQDLLLLPTLFNAVNGKSKIAKIINETGFRKSQSQIIAAWLKLTAFANICQANSIPIAKLATKGLTIPNVCENYADFIQQPVVDKFNSLNKSTAPYQNILAASTVRLLKGLAEMDIDKKYKEKKIYDLVQISYFRILNAMNDAILRKDNFMEFYNQLEFIHQEIQNILLIVEPYDETEFEKSVIANFLTNPSSLFSPKFDKPKVHLKASCMHSVASILASVEAQKGSNELNVVLLKDCYFEISDAFKENKTYQLSIFDGDKFKSQGIEEALSKSLKKIDVFVCEFNHNISLTRNNYCVEDIIGQFKAMKNKGLLAEKCSIVIDTTLNLEQSEEARKLLVDPGIHKMIEQGELNVVLVRSAQKFDMLGFDNYYGGISLTFNDKKSFTKFNERMDHKLDQLKGLNYQGLTHLQKFGEIDNYRKALIESTSKFYNKIPKELIYHDKMSYPMRISKREDNGYFLDFKFSPYLNIEMAVVFTFVHYFAKKRKLPLTYRNSFGFATTNLTRINRRVLRLNPGLEDEETIDQYIYFIKLVQKTIDKCLADNPGKSVDELDQIMMNEIYTLYKKADF